MSRTPQLCRMMVVAAALGAGTALPLRLAAQATSLHKDAMVRVVSPPATPGQSDSIVTGSLVRLVDDTAIIDAGWVGHTHELLAFDLEGDTHLEVLQGGHEHLWGILGIFGGAAIGAGIFDATYKRCLPTCSQTERHLVTMIGVVLGATGGGLLGAVIDSKHHGGRWVPVDTRRVQVSLGPGGFDVRAEF